MRESRLYLNFFRSNLLLILVPTAISVVGSFWYISRVPGIPKITVVYESSFEGDLDKKLMLIDQAVSTTRAPEVLSELVRSPAQARIYKSAPLSVTVEVKDPDRMLIGGSVSRIGEHLTSKYPLVSVGSLYSLEKPKSEVIIFLGLLVGFTLGTIIALFKTYFRNY